MRRVASLRLAAPRALNRRWLRRIALAVALALGALALAIAALAVWLHDEPSEAMRARVGDVARVEVLDSASFGGDLVTDERLVSTTGLEVTLRVRRPPDGAPRSGATLLILGGLERGRFAVDLLPELRGHVVAALDYPYDGPKRKVRANDLVRGFGALRRALLDTPPAAMLARRHLATLPFVDPDRIELVGASLGGIFVCYVGALDPGFKRVFCLHAGGDVDALIAKGLERKIGVAPLRAAISWLPRYMLGGYGPERFVPRIAPRPFVMVCASGDERIPRGSVESLFDAASEPKELVWVDGVHLDGDRRETLAPILEVMFARLEGP